MKTNHKYLFGPVPSRRYGSSLGVDLCVPKSCILNCRFCQLGTTPKTTLVRSALPSIAEILTELRAWFAAADAMPDFITASGSGEPTLHLHFGDVFRFARDETACRSLLLTNGTLLYLPEVRREAALADVVKLSLHAWDQASFEAVTRPHGDLKLETVLNGFRAFRQVFAGHLDLEVFIIPGINDSDAQVARIAALAREFAPDAVALNTAVRPPADSSVLPCPPARLNELARHFGASAQASSLQLPSGSGQKLDGAAALNLITRHPLPVHELTRYFKCSTMALETAIAPLLAQGLLRRFEQAGVPYIGGAAPQDT